MNELLGLEIIWVHVSRLPVPHLDKTDGNILCLTSFLLLGGDATQFLFFVNLSCFMLAHHCLAHVCWWCFIPFCSLLIILTLHCTDGGVGNSSSLSYTPSSTCAISFHSSTCGISAHEFLHTYKITSTTKLPVLEHLMCFGLLVTKLSFPCSLHMPLITTFLCSF